MDFQTTTMVYRLENFKFLNYNNGLRLGWGAGVKVKLYTPLRVVKNGIIFDVVIWVTPLDTPSYRPGDRSIGDPCS